MNPAARLKVKGDTAYLPDGEGGVYFRNNVGSFRLNGSMMDRWIEKLFPVFNGQHTMEELADGLPEPHRNRLFEIAGTLLSNGFVRDVSEDMPHRLPVGAVKRFAAQIEFLDNLEGSGGYRFQNYRQANVLAIGTGGFGVSLAAALLESGLTRFHLMLLDAEPGHRERISELAAFARQSDEHTKIEELAAPQLTSVEWRAIIAPFDWILYASEEANPDRFRVLHRACLDERKVLLPALIIERTGIAGPVVSPDSPGCWESAWRRVHQAALERDPQLHTASSTAESMLANVLAFELFKSVTGSGGVELQNQVFLLNLETLEASRHAFIPHPLVNGVPSITPLRSLEQRPEPETAEAAEEQLLQTFYQLTSPVTGIFHVWDEGELRQLPLSVCRVQAVDPVSNGPAALLPELLCGGFTHEEARLEAGLTGLEAYASRLHGLPADAGVGAGRTLPEGVCRGLLQRLKDELRIQTSFRRPVLYPVQLTEIQDDRIGFYLRALTTMRGEPTIAAGEPVSGFPVMWVGTGTAWYGSVDLNRPRAIRSALLMALIKEQIHEPLTIAVRAVEASSVLLAEYARPQLSISACEDQLSEADLQAARQVLRANGKQLEVSELGMEPSAVRSLAGVYGVALQEEESR